MSAPSIQYNTAKNWINTKDLGLASNISDYAAGL